MYPSKVRTLKEINNDCERPVTSEELVLQSIKMQSNTPTHMVEEVTGLASSTVSKALKILQEQKLITKDLLNSSNGGVGNSFTAYFSAVA